MLLPFRGPSKTQQTGKEHAGRTALKLALTSDAPRPGPSGPRKEGTPAAPGNLDPALPSSPRQQGTQGGPNRILKRHFSTQTGWNLTFLFLTEFFSLPLPRILFNAIYIHIETYHGKVLENLITTISKNVSK